MNTFNKTFRIQCTETDVNKKFKAYAALCATQEIAQDHASKLGFGYDQLNNMSCFWVLSRIKLRFNSCPFWREILDLKTWHKGSAGVFAFRDFEFKKGEDVVIQGTSSWLVLDAATHRMVKPESVIDNQSESVCAENAVEEVCEKLISPKDMQFCRTKEVAYSDIDMLGHTNNAKYLEWAFDSIDPQILYTKEISELQVNFVAETRLGEKIEIYSKEVSESEWFVEGKREGKVVFQMRLQIR